ncbi:MarR family winged helix-turn-helix transcriptional regulator [Alteribacillus sp. YIM 98480]|uniref:MarR family winged helix-turn-helix transcriptional regulator n=1 Tax=Alteribacillus sp. YIM 98480 TaxID=2606599 RepID=UPI00131A8130|nr:MarR family transcriptional regulator [Alteribacillus sp. YIM 98480]
MDTSALFHLLNQKVRLLSKELNEHLQKHDLYTSQWTILYVLSQKGPMSQTDIWQYLKVEAPTMTRTLARMETSGWIHRKPGKDKRERIVVLTEEAKEKLPDVMKTIKQFEQQFVAHISNSEQDQLYHLLEKLGTKRSDE